MPKSKLWRTALAATSALALASPALADELVVEGILFPTRSITIGPDDLASTDRIEALKDRIATASKAVCKEMNFQHTGAHWTRRACAHLSEDDALRQLARMIGRGNGVAANQAGGVISVRAR